jgi:hypothetical protein
VEGNAQVNLVPNPSFEDTTHCPATGGLDGLSNWFYCGGSPDYYNSCANGVNPPSGVPNNWLGHQTTRNGQGYVGLITWIVAASPQREFMGVQLAQTLSPGTKYFVTAYIVRADSGDVPPSTCASDNFGFLFSTIPYDYVNSAPVNNFSHVHSDTIVSNAIAWTKISGSFIADSTYAYMTLGNFYNNSNTDTINCSYSNQAYAYYFIDDVCVSVDSGTCEIPEGFVDSNLGDVVIGLYPNPATDKIAVTNLPNSTNYNCSVYNILGELVFMTLINGNQNEIPLPPLNSGTYFLEINTTYLKFVITNK